ncbi:hypothetical protein AB0M20_35085, partial [Actinoplanes sp. NPDC051633]|uniref:hypothetical protein n=1 Tax=Actinoplanes sp. NPDC051633 TaxID=3155670 RepID=UPI003445C3F0
MQAVASVPVRVARTIMIHARTPTRARITTIRDARSPVRSPGRARRAHRSRRLVPAGGGSAFRVANSGGFPLSNGGSLPLSNGGSLPL